MECITKSKESFLTQDVLEKVHQCQQIFTEGCKETRKEKTFSQCPTW